MEDASAGMFEFDLRPTTVVDETVVEDGEVVVGADVVEELVEVGSGGATVVVVVEVVVVVVGVGVVEVVEETVVVLLEDRMGDLGKSTLLAVSL